MNLFKRLQSYFPTNLPVGITEFEAWASEVIKLAGKGIPDNRSTRFALTSMIAHGTKPTHSSKPKIVFARMLRKAAANEVAIAIYEKLNKEKQADEKLEKELKANETATIQITGK